MTSNRIRTIERGFVSFLLKFILLSGWRHLTDRMTSSYWWDGIIFLTGWRHLSDRMTSSYWRDGVILPAELVHLYLYQLHKRLFNSSVSDFLGTAGDSLSVHHDQSFSTRDQDNDGAQNRNCATGYQGAWWYNSCRHSNLNGMYYDGGAFQLEDGVTWYHWKGHKYSLKRTEMKIRPVDF